MATPNHTWYPALNRAVAPGTEVRDGRRVDIRTGNAVTERPTISTAYFLNAIVGPKTLAGLRTQLSQPPTFLSHDAILAALRQLSTVIIHEALTRPELGFLHKPLNSLPAPVVGVTGRTSIASVARSGSSKDQAAIVDFLDRMMQTRERYGITDSTTAFPPLTSKPNVDLGGSGTDGKRLIGPDGSVIHIDSLTVVDADTYAAVVAYDRAYADDDVAPSVTYELDYCGAMLALGRTSAVQMSAGASFQTPLR